MKRKLMFTLCALFCAPVLAAHPAVSAVKPIGAALPDGTYGWELHYSGENVSIQNVIGGTEPLLVDIYINPTINGKSPDAALLYGCAGQASGVTLTPGIDYICQVPYPGQVFIYDLGAVNGVSGEYGLINQGGNSSTGKWAVSSGGPATVVNNLTSLTLKILYTTDYYTANTTNPADPVLVSCMTNKTFRVTRGSANLCLLAPNSLATVTLSAGSFKYGSSGSYKVVN